MRQPADQVPRDEFGRLLGKEDIPVDEIENLDGHVLKSLSPHQKDDRHFETALAHEIDQRRGLALEPLLPPIDDKTTDGGIGLHRHFGVFDAARADDLESEPFDGRDDLLDAQTFEVFGIESRCREQKGKSLGKVHVPDLLRDARHTLWRWVTLM